MKRFKSKILLVIGLALGLVFSRVSWAAEPVTDKHFTVNGDFDSMGNYLPAKVGFNLADVSSVSALNSLPPGMMGVFYVGLCNGVDSNFLSIVKPLIGNTKLFALYLMDEPDPTGQWNTYCDPANLKAESDWVHANMPGVKTFIVLMNMGSSANPSFQNTYSPQNSHVDLFGLDPYPCRTVLGGCDLDMINGQVNAAIKWGIPLSSIIPVYQTFGGGDYTDDLGGQYALPTATQLRQILGRWGELVPNPVFDYAYSWGSQNSDTALESAPDLQAVMAAHNALSGSAPPLPPPPPPVKPPLDTKAPAVTLVRPANKMTVPTRAKVSIAASASDNVGVVKVEFYVNGALYCTDKTAPYTCELTTARRSGRTYRIQAKAYDAAGNAAVSNLVTVTSR